jgi:2-polyprenyl-3-methyl-5-hydroxy-6-metoxy-1,4-benzoquinol methylase
MNNFQEKEAVQDMEYNYPYHYIPFRKSGRFSQTHTMTWGHEYLSYIHWVADKVTELGFGSLLDVGCGDGRFLNELKQRVSGKRLVGVDYSQRAIAYAKIINPDVEWLCEDIRTDGVLNEQFDIITLIDVLEHIPPPEIHDFLSGLADHLKQFGSLVVTVPSVNVRLANKHYQHFDIDTLEKAVRPSFRISDKAFINWNGALIVRIIKRLICNRLFVIRETRLLNWLYEIYQSKYFFTEASKCSRIAVTCRMISD